MQAFTKRGLYYSIFLFFHSVSEEQESRAWIGLLLVVAVSETSIEIIAFTCEDLHFVELFKNELNEGSCSLLESWNSVSLSLFFKLGLDLLDVFYE